MLLKLDTRFDLHFSFFILDVGVRVKGGDIGTLDVGSERTFSSFGDLSTGLCSLEGLLVVREDWMLSVVFLLEILIVSPPSNVSLRVSGFGLSLSGVLLKLEADFSASIQLFLMPWVTAERTYCLSSKVETMKP